MDHSLGGVVRRGRRRHRRRSSGPNFAERPPGVAEPVPCSCTVELVALERDAVAFVIISVEREPNSFVEREPCAIERESLSFVIERESLSFVIERESLSFVIEREPLPFAIEREPLPFAIEREPLPFAVEREPFSFVVECEPRTVLVESVALVGESDDAESLVVEFARHARDAESVDPAEHVDQIDGHSGSSAPSGAVSRAHRLPLAE